MYQKLQEMEDYLIDCWCEINGGGVVTLKQIDAMNTIVQQLKEMYPEFDKERK